VAEFGYGEVGNMILEYSELVQCDPNLPVYHLILPFEFFKRIEKETLEEVLLSVKTTAGDALKDYFYPRVVVSPEMWKLAMTLDAKNKIKESQELLEKLREV